MPAPARFTVSVRELCAFAAQSGDLDLRFGIAPTALEGMVGHALVGSRRSPAYEREIPLQGTYGSICVRGRADGYDHSLNRLEEIKTYRGDLERLPPARRHLHRSQALLYGSLLCATRGLTHLTVALVYYNVTTQTETIIAEECSAAELHQHFADCYEKFEAWAIQELSHRQQRDAWLAQLEFPFPAFRPGQRELAKAVFLASRDQRCLCLQAPTGIGKSLGTLFPLLKAMPPHGLDKIFFLSARTTGRRVALDALRRLAGAGTSRLRVVELLARDKACAYPGRACTGEACPRARGFFDRLPAARNHAVRAAWLDAPVIRDIAENHAVCPYYLGQELARWADVVVGDYNYYFDHTAFLRGLTNENSWRAAVLVDEAHNLIARARDMYSAELGQPEFAQLKKQYPALKACWQHLQRAWRDTLREQQQPYAAYDVVPDGLRNALRSTITSLADYLEHNAVQGDARLQEWYFNLLRFQSLADTFGEHSVFDITVPRPGNTDGSSLCIRNIVPAPFLADAIQAARTVILFSATLGPQDYYAQLLGLPAGTARHDTGSPFSADQLQVRVATQVSTRWTDRAASLPLVAEIIAQQYREAPGLYLAYFSSYQYLDAAMRMLNSSAPDVPAWCQSRHMTEAERTAFLDQFVPGNRGIGFAVLGGAFGEGIDLPGDRLVGAFIATLGLPQVNPVNEVMRERLDRLFGAGYEYTYLYPGIQKVVQAAGRVIRTTSDRGTVVLLDDRYQQPRIRQLLPSWWRIARYTSIPGRIS